MEISAFLFLLLGLVIGVALGWALATVRAAGTYRTETNATSAALADAAQWRARAEELAARTQASEQRAEADVSVLRALEPVRTQLEQVGKRVEAMERQHTSAQASLTEQLRAAARAEKDLLQTTTTLASALHSRSSRGMWGEVELARVLEVSGMLPHVDFYQQRTVGAIVAQRGGAQINADADKLRPDVVVHLPADGYIAIDAKVPMDAYLRAAALTAPANAAQAASLESQRQKLLAEHAKALRSHIKTLAERRYDKALGASPQLVVLFVPAEPILSAALEADPQLMEYALEHAVALTSPASLLALLRICATAWARTAVNEDAAQLLEIGQKLYERLGVVAKHLNALGTCLTRSVKAYNQTVSSVESRLLVTARTFENLGPDLVTPQSISADGAQVRSFTATELTAPDAADADPDA